MSNHIDHIEITNFKSIRHAKIEGCKRINVFIGYPNVGKSAILEAMAALSYFQVEYSGPYSDVCRYKNSSELFFDGNTNEEIEITYSKDTQVIMRSIHQQTLDLLIRTKRGLQEVHDGATISYSDGQFLKYLVFSGKHVENTQKDVHYSRSRKFIQGSLAVKKYDFKNALNDHKTNHRTLNAPYGENLVDIVQTNRQLRKEVSDLFKFYHLKLSIDQETNAIKALKQLDDETIFLIPLYQMADTLQRLIFHKAAIMSNENTVLLFEEPEAHMFPPYISKITADVIHDEKNNQYFIATHSPFVLNDLMEDARNELSIYAVGLHNGETTIKRITDEEMHEIYQYGIDLFFNLEDYLKDV